ncbi:EI24 domain-containing protein [Orrella dioscoreae]|uniref:EI24 domain-containing protein n=1 Tax=Orrella dioscoreae TaxID=1851544 RepID=UPI00082E3F38|nr:EI24 domain-containing protein [Orrella dioscoreae]
MTRHIDLSQPSPRSAGFAGVGRAFKRAAVSQCHPRMLFALLLPFLVMFFGAILLLWLFWTPLTGWLAAEAARWDTLNRVDEWLLAVGVFSIKIWLVPLLACAILLPCAGALGLVVAAIVVMPLVLRHIVPRDYPGIAKRGRHTLAIGLWNAVWVMAVFALGWLLTLPLWLFPPMALLLSVFWWAFAFTLILRVDALADHASPEERRLLLKRHSLGFWAVGGICSLINLLPPAWIVLPVFSSLVFAHFGLDALTRLRQESGDTVILEPPRLP